MSRTLMLNVGYEPIRMVSWQRAICLIFSSKAEIVAEYEQCARTVTASYPLPSVIRLNQYVRPAWTSSVRLNRKNILLRDNYRCQYCNKLCKGADATIDHVLPRSRGGASSWENLVTSCSSCNSKKGNHLPEEKQMPLRRQPRRPRLHEIFRNSQRGSVPESWSGFLEHPS